MSSTPFDIPAGLNPLALWRDWVVKSEAQWSEALSTLLKDERASTAFTQQVDEARMMHRQFSEVAQATLALANMPSRSDIEALDERLGKLEDGLAEVSAALVQLRQALVAQGAAALPAAPARNRKPPAVAAAPTPAPQATSKAARKATPQPARKRKA